MAQGEETTDFLDKGLDWLDESTKDCRIGAALGALAGVRSGVKYGFGVGVAGAISTGAITAVVTVPVATTIGAAGGAALGGAAGCAIQHWANSEMDEVPKAPPAGLNPQLKKTHMGKQ